MYRLALVLAAGFLVACGDGRHAEAPPPAAEELTPVPHAGFADPRLQEIATRLTEEAERRGIRSVRGRWNRVESLIQLEAELGTPPFALEYVNRVANTAVATDTGYWPSIRSGEFARCREANHAACRRTHDLLERWYRHRLATVLDDLGHENIAFRYGGRDWERIFHEFISRSPRDAATWGAMVSRHATAEVRASIGRSDGTAAYGYYLVRTGLGTLDEAAVVFSVPGVELRER
jgi:hypothetical protein